MDEKPPNYNLKLYGVDPSQKSIKFGNKKFININLKKGTSNYLEFENSFFDIVFCGSFLMWIDRELVFKTLSEIDRVLKEGGFLNIVDFDVIVPYKNGYKHCKRLYSYKNDYTKFFTGGGNYTIIAKSPQYPNVESFSKNIDNRYSTSILYKEFFNEIYN